MTKAMNFGVSFELCPGEVQSFQIDRSGTLVIESATEKSVWMTRDGDSFDYWLSVGDSVMLCKGDRITVGLDKVDGALKAKAALNSLSAVRSTYPGGSQVRAVAAVLARAMRLRWIFAGTGACRKMHAPLVKNGCHAR